MTAVTIGHIIG